MPSLRRHLRLVLLLALLLAAAPSARPAFAQTFTVTNTGDVDDGIAGACGGDGCSLREAIRLANQNPGADTIAFNLAGASPHRILPATALPAITGDGTTLDGTNLANSSEHTIVLSGEAMAGGGQLGHGLVLRASNSVIRDMVIGGFPRGDADVTSGAAIFVDGSFGGGDGNSLFNNWLGLDAGGTAALNNGRYGVRIFGDADNTVIGGTGADQRNVISGGGVANVGVGGAGDVAANNNTSIVGNFIGTNVAGTGRPSGVDTDRTQAGINVDTTATGTRITDNLVGGLVPGAAANPEIAGIFVAGFGTAADSSRIPTGTVIQRNLIGVTAAGAPVPNRVGILIGGGPNYGPYNTTIGDPTNPAAGRNVIAGNTVRGIEIADSSFKFGNVTIAGNLVGLTPAGTPLPNGVNGQSNGEGIFVGRYDAAASGANPVVAIGPANVVSANITFGIRIRSGGHVVRGNFIGTSLDGSSSALQVITPSSYTPNTANGAASIWLENGQGVTIGGDTAADRNVIAFSGSTAGPVGAGILIDPDAANIPPPGSTCGTGTPCSTGNHSIRGNYIGVRAAGDAALNGSSGEQFQRELIRISRSNGNTISNNVIGGGGVGVGIGTASASASDNVVRDNKIGTRASGVTGALATLGVRNQQDGLRILNGTNNLVQGNLIAFNGDATIPDTQEFHGILVSGAGASNNDIVANRLVRNGDSFGGHGIFVTGATGITISRTETSLNVENGIALTSIGFTAGNNNRAPPTLGSVAAGTPPTVSGTAASCDGCTVEIFTSPTSEPDEGPIYLATGTVSGGSFSIPIPGCQRYLTATLTDGAGNTSPFSAVLDSGNPGPCAAPFTLTLSEAPLPNPRNVAPGASTIFTHTLTHNAPVERTYTILIDSSLDWASGPTSVTLPAAPSGGTASANFGVTVSVPVGTPNSPPADVTTVQATLGSLSSEVRTDTTNAQAVALNPAAPAVSPGQSKPFAPNSVTFTHFVTNTGQLAGVFEVVAPEVVGAPAGFSIASATLADPNLTGGESTTLTIVVNTPATAPAPGNITVRFRVGVVGGQQTAPVDDVIVVAAVRSFTFTPEAPQAKSTPAGSDVTFDFVLTNTGNAADSFSVSGAIVGAGNPLTVVGVTAEPSLTNLAAGASSNVRVTFRVPPGTTASPPTYDVSVTAQASGGASPPPAIVRTATVTVTGGGSATITPGAGTPDPVDVRSAAGSVTFVNRVENTGNAAVPIEVPASFTAPAGFTAATTANTCDDTPTIAPGAFCEFTVVVNVPQGADAGSYDITVSATANNSAQAGPPPNVVATAINRVNVLRVRGVQLNPDSALSGAPGELLTFTHTLTNTGNGEDDFTLAFVASVPGWSVVLTPTVALDVPRNGTRSVTVTARVPNVAPAGATNVITVTATVQGGIESDTAVDTATVASITAADLSPGTRKNVDAGQTATFTHTLTNTGTTTGAFTLTAQNSTPGFTAQLTGSPTVALAPGEQASVSVQVTAPTTATVGISNTTTLSVFANGTTTPLLDDEQDITVVGPAFGVLLAPDNTGTRPPDSTAVFTHTLTNVGSTQGLFSLTGAESNGWPVTITPNLVNLGAGQSFDVEVRVLIPDGPRAGTRGFARVTAQLVGNPAITDDATNDFTIASVAGVDLSASQVRVVSLGTPQRLSGLNVYNSGNAFDTFDLRALNVPAGWTVTLTPATVPVDKDSTFRVAVEVILPASTPRDVIAQITVEAQSRNDPSVRDSISLTLIYPGVPERRTVYLPMLRR